jgi:hypothetical protein
MSLLAKCTNVKTLATSQMIAYLGRRANAHSAVYVISWTKAFLQKLLVAKLVKSSKL